MKFKARSRSLLVFVIFLGTFFSNVLSEPISNFTKPTTLPKYFAIDVDGTFFIKDETKFKRNIAALKLLKEKNVIAFFCTVQMYLLNNHFTFCSSIFSGTSFNAIKNKFGADFQREAAYNLLPGIYSNGSIIYDNYGILIHKSVFKSDFIEKFIKFVNDKNYRSHVVFFGVVDIYSLEASLEPKDELTLNLTPIVKSDSELKNLDITGIRIKKINIEVEGLTEGTDFVKFDEAKVNVIFPELSLKDLSLKKLIERWDGKISECAYIGNDMNDLSVMSLPDIMSFAVADAKDEIKNNAKWVLDLKHDECAFEKVVNLLYGDQN
ncbi:uncharacterized protein TA16220 [Theileria annulata]|uniref:Haloacid dehalogenase-like hydrolase n=1 Tax=Theileria annulata TaxID=5874 RepID=Q4UIS5_THEAN|nr:uncharacterized protein TA16220 [Theileria annulata]CAI73014.1 hypothetical protein, conserved [Theileria annulata]|eukprot:XP_953692.1 hypothetical protein, conserved [Theileria annulata]